MIPTHFIQPRNWLQAPTSPGGAAGPGVGTASACVGDCGDQTPHVRSRLGSDPFISVDGESNHSGLASQGIISPDQRKVGGGLGLATSGQNQRVPHPAAVTAAVVYGSSVAAHFPSRQVPPRTPCTDGERVGTHVAGRRQAGAGHHDSLVPELDLPPAAMIARRWTTLMYLALREPQIQARIARLEREIGIVRHHATTGIPLVSTPPSPPPVKWW